MTKAEQTAKCQTDLLSFACTMFKENTGSDFLINWHHEQICKALERVVVGKTKRLIINLPPRYSKTEIAVINFIAWTLGIFPDSEFIHTSYSHKLAENNTARTKALVESDAYKNIFPDVSLEEKAKARGEWKTTAGGVVYASGSGGTITGYGAGKKRDCFGGAIIIDDPHKASEISSKVVRQGVIEWFINTMLSRRNSPNTPIIIIMQRLHEDDLTGFLLKGGNNEKWDNLVLPVIDDQGSPLWEYMHSKKDIEVIKKTSFYVYSAQYLQRPSPAGGGLFKDEFWKYYTTQPQVEYMIITGDTAQKTGEHNDFTVFQLWGYNDGNIYLIDQVRGKWEAPELVTQFVNFWQKWDDRGAKTEGGLRSAYIEDKSSGTGLIQTIKAEYNIPIIGIPRNRDKVSRANDGVVYIATGKVHIPRPDIKQWVNLYVGEFSSFTENNTHKHDDQIDPTLDAISILLIKTNKKKIRFF